LGLVGGGEWDEDHPGTATTGTHQALHLGGPTLASLLRQPLCEMLSLVVAVASSGLMATAPVGPVEYVGLGMDGLVRFFGFRCRSTQSTVQLVHVSPFLIPGAVIAGGGGEERRREHGQGDVPVPGVVGADLVVIQSGLVLRELERFLDTPSRSAKPDQFQRPQPSAGYGRCSRPARSAC
jgi:hypothetical protein